MKHGSQQNYAIQKENISIAANINIQLLKKLVSSQADCQGTL